MARTLDEFSVASMTKMSSSGRAAILDAGMWELRYSRDNSSRTCW